MTRRVVTGKDERGSIVYSDSVLDWVRTVPVAVPDLKEGGLFRILLHEEAGVWWNIYRYPPNTEIAVHEVPTIDYLYLLEGSIEVLLDTGSVELAAGDCLVERGPSHGWRTGSSEAVVLGVFITR